MFSLLKNRIAMTLVEVLTAVLILSIVVVPLTSFFIMSQRRAHHTLVQRQAMALAEARLEEMRHDRFDDVFLYREGGEGIPVITDGRFAIHTEVEPILMPGGDPDDPQHINRIIIRVVWETGQVSVSTLASPLR